VIAPSSSGIISLFEPAVVSRKRGRFRKALPSDCQDDTVSTASETSASKTINSSQTTSMKGCSRKKPRMAVCSRQKTDSSASGIIIFHFNMHL
jgi:hypothetical protein